MRICVRINGRLHCFTIPVLYNPWWWLQPEGPESTQSQPQPQPWFTQEGIEVEAAKELQALATISALAQGLSEESRSAVLSGLDRALSRVKAQLPEGFEIHSSPVAR